MRPPVALDALDVALLDRLQTSTRQTAEQLGAEIGLSASAVQRRLARLRGAGAIRAEVAVVDPTVAGRHLTIVTQVVLERGRAETLGAFSRAIAAEPAVQQCYHVTGEFDLLLILALRDMADYEQLTRRLFYANPQIRRFTTSAVIGALKIGLRVPLESTETR